MACDRDSQRRCTLQEGAGRVLPLLSSLLVLLCTIPSCGVKREPPVTKVLLVGLDGLDWQILDPLIKDGSLPNLSRFIRRGASGKLGTLLPTYSPIIWSSVITGKTPEKHGINHFGAPGPRGPDGKPSLIPFTTNSRRCKALWNIIGDAGRDVASVGWWTTWPAEEVSGVMVSDRLMYNRFNVWLKLSEAGGDLPCQTYPQDLVTELLPDAVMPEGLADEVFRRFLPDSEPHELKESLHDPLYELTLVYGRDKAYGRVLDKVRSSQSFSFVATYFNGIDIASHYLWKYRFPEQWDSPVDPVEQKKYGKVIDRYCTFIDETVGSLLEEASKTCLVVVVSDHGFVAGRRNDSPNISGTHYQSKPPGVILMAGGSVPSGATIEGASVYDVAPSILHALGLSVAKDMDGKVLPILLGPGGKDEISYRETYEETGVSLQDPTPIQTEYDAGRVEQLKALGYLEEEDDPEQKDTKEGIQRKRRKR